MNIRYCLSFVLTVCLSVMASAQDSTKARVIQSNNSIEADRTASNLARAKFQINDIRSRGIIVRLTTNQDRIDAYRKGGYKKIADNLEEKSKMTNLLLTYAFITEWTYSPVYFMESQHTAQLMQTGELTAKTYDLLRDTVIHVNKDSFFIVDFGDLMANEPMDPNTTFGNIGKTKQSNTPAGTGYIVAKDHQQQQLQDPFPFFAKVIFEDFNSTGSMEPIHIPEWLADSTAVYFRRYPSFAQWSKSETKQTITQYLTLIYNHVQSTSDGNKYEKAVGRFNKHFIEYYCKRLDKDQDLLCNNDPFYWWLRDPNIPYFPALPQIEQKLKSYMDKDPKFIRTY